jgi:c-di-GMP-binding flagellar brake protein YcgR
MLRERRRYARLPFCAVVNCRLGTKQFKTESVNISGGGILLAASGGAIVGDELNLEFALAPQTPAVRVRAKVVRKEASDRTATMFLTLEAPDQQAISDYILGRIKS